MNGWSGENSWWCMYSTFYHVLIVVAYELVNAYLEPGLTALTWTYGRLHLITKKQLRNEINSLKIQ